MLRSRPLHLPIPALLGTLAAIGPGCKDAGLTGEQLKVASGALTVRPVQHASLALGWKGLVIYVDPAGDPRRWQGLPPPQAILITDVHEDHFDAGLLGQLAAAGPRIVAPHAVADELARLGVPPDRVTRLANGETASLGQDASVLAVPMYNLTPERLQYHPRGRGNGYVLELGGSRVYISGDTEDVPEARALEDVQVAFICMNLPFTMSAEQAAGLTLALKPRVAVPYHYRGPEPGGWQSPDRFEKLVRGQSREIQVRVLPWYGEDETPTWMWLLFAGLVAVVMFIDLGICHKAAHQTTTREALAWVCVWVTLALVFNVAVGFWKGGRPAIEFLTGYLVELGLSVDNIFVFVVLFSYFSVRPEHQHRVLFWGILGAMVMRMAFIFVGIAFVQQFGWLMYVFGAFLVYTGIKLFGHEPEVDPEKNWVLRLSRRLLPVTSSYDGEKFFVREAPQPRLAVEAGGGPPAGGPGPAAGAALPRGRLMVTPLFLVLIVVEATDVLFAVDSVPAILGVTSDRFIAFTSNIFAILGLRAMYFVLVGILDKFHYLKYGLSLVLVFIGVKMLVHHWVDDWFRTKTQAAVASLVIVVTLLGGSIALSLLFPPRRRPLEPESPDETAGGNDGQ